MHFLQEALGPALGMALVALDLVIVIALIPHVVLQRRESGATLAWVFFILLVPYLGPVVFWVFGTTRVRLFRAGPAAFDAPNRSIEEARHHVHLLYYIWQPDTAGAYLRAALVRAAKRDVEVRLLLDDVGARRAKARFFAPLAVAMLHAKTATIDGRFSTVDSTNMDQRSFRLNVEANAFFYGSEMAKALERSFVATQAEARPIKLQQIKRRSYRTRLLEGAARTLAPVL